MTSRAIAILLLTAVLFGCRRPDDQRTGSVDTTTVRQAREQLDPAVLARIDSGNVAFREQRYQDALRLYQEAAQRDSDAAPAWFGIYMAETALGNVAAAEDAIRRARAAAPRASLVEEGAGEGTVPPGTQPAAPAASPTDTGRRP